MTVSPIHTWTKLKGKSQVKLPVGFLLYLLVILPSQILQNLTEKIQQRICLMFVRVSSRIETLVTGGNILIIK